MRRRQTIALLALVGFCIALYLWLYKIGIIGTIIEFIVSFFH